MDLGTLAGKGCGAAAINNRGQVVGSAQAASGEWHAYVWQDGRMRDLGTLGGKASAAVAINERGQSAEAGGFRRADTHSSGNATSARSAVTGAKQ